VNFKTKERTLEESTIAILADAYKLLSQIMLEGDISTPPKQLLGSNPKAVPLGKASLEQRAIATLYGQVCKEHKHMHETENLPEGINPRVSFTHYQNHVMAPMLSELLIWSAHRDYPDVSERVSIIAIQLDADWNMYAIPRVPAESAS